MFTLLLIAMSLTTTHDLNKSGQFLSNELKHGKTYNEINRMSAGVLNSICRNFNIDTSLPRTAKVNAVCHCLNISTTGDSQLSSTLTVLPSATEALTKTQLRELQALTPKVLYMLTDW